MCASSNVRGVNAPDLSTEVLIKLLDRAKTLTPYLRFAIFRAVLAVLKTAAAALVSTRINNVFLAELALYLLLGLREIRHTEAWLCHIPFDHLKRLVSCYVDHQAHECTPS